LDGARTNIELVASVLEDGIPLKSEPFLDVAFRLGLPEALVIDTARELIGSGYMRRFGAFFDFRRLGWNGYLFGVMTPVQNEKNVVSAIEGMDCVTHLYGRRHPVGLWFTALLENAQEAEDVAGVLGLMACRCVALDVSRRIKLRPSFAYRSDFGTKLSEEEETLQICAYEGQTLKIAKALQDGIEVSRRPFKNAADILGVSEAELLNAAKSLKRSGILRKVGASLNHNRAGWISNSLCAFDMAAFGESDAEKTASRVTSDLPWVSHCYLRRVFYCDLMFPWRYNLYIMIHAKTDDELAERENILTCLLPDAGFISLRTVAEYKKISFRL
jgi:DNA-binding Lrp family transcriptional regulator